MKYRFKGHWADRLWWESGRIPGDSRVEQVSCDAHWFYSMMLGAGR
ncbi:hypothetical protein [Nocardioides mesophilus]|uniref:Uncharacterized protein n=1 Tax=Nocardioides mesophilus TaxID=433659 RepID=A0A7G9RA67_9ACTN|nr:hypothetical protein [Nocardioides mesophilus]QNN52492.1 hypothetical protein H9L09_18790 [Nocardioides mesophilus]